MSVYVCSATPFYVACQNGHLEVVKYLHVEAKVEVNCADEVGMVLRRQQTGKQADICVHE